MCIYIVSVWLGDDQIWSYTSEERGEGGLGFCMKSVRKEGVCVCVGGGGGVSSRPAIHSDLIWIIQIFILKFTEIQNFFALNFVENFI